MIASRNILSQLHSILKCLCHKYSTITHFKAVCKFVAKTSTVITLKIPLNTVLISFLLLLLNHLFFHRCFCIVTVHVLKLVCLPVKTTVCESPAFGSAQTASLTLPSASLCLFACVTFDLVFLCPNLRQRCIFYTDPACLEAPAPVTRRILPSRSAGCRGSWTRKR